jgi:hypothetical protein
MQAILKRQNHVFEDVRWVLMHFMLIYITDCNIMIMLLHKFNMRMVLLDSWIIECLFS